MKCFNFPFSSVIVINAWLSSKFDREIYIIFCKLTQKEIIGLKVNFAGTLFIWDFLRVKNNGLFFHWVKKQELTKNKFCSLKWK